MDDDEMKKNQQMVEESEAEQFELDMTALKKSNLVPLSEAQKIDYETWDAHTSDEHKWELYDGFPFSTSSDTAEIDRLLICLLYCVGIRRFVDELLPAESKAVLLRELLKDNEKIRK